MKTWQVVLLSVFFGLLAGAAIVITTGKPRGEPILIPPQPTQAPIVIQVNGAVQKPGVYTLPSGSRVREAIQAAGGLQPSANAEIINLVALLGDGQKLTIPTVPPPGQPAPVVQSSGASQPAPAGSKIININTATQEELDSLPGIGAGKAASIIEYRQKHGQFAKIQDLMNVPGIGQGIFDTIKDLICVDDIMQ